MESGVWIVVCGGLSVECVVWSVVCGVRSVECGVWCEVCGDRGETCDIVTIPNCIKMADLKNDKEK